MEWDLQLKYKNTKFIQKAKVEYKSKQIIRISVQWSKSALLLQNDYPAIKFTNSKRGVHWKVLEPKSIPLDKGFPGLLNSIFSQLEYLIKKDFDKIYPQDLF